MVIAKIIWPTGSYAERQLYVNINNIMQTTDEVKSKVEAQGITQPSEEAFATAMRVQKGTGEIARYLKPEAGQQAQEIIDQRSKFWTAVRKGIDEKKDQLPSDGRLSGDAV